MAYSKYAAKPTHVDGIRFASKREAARYGELSNLQRAGIITHLELQPRFPLIVNGQVVCTYVGDFRYLENGMSVTEDVKGFKTAEYKIKRKLLLATHPGIDHREIGIGKGRATARKVSPEIQQIFRDAQRRRA
jgi:hypothetical protein